MPGWEYDNRLGTMVPKKKRGLEFHALNGGLKVIDNDLNTSFIILRRNDEINYAQGIAGTRGVKLFDYRKAMQIADRVKRVLPASKYTDYKKFCKGIPESEMSDEDYVLLETLVNGYKDNSLNEALNELNYSIGTESPQHSDLQTKGAKDYHGVSGLIKSLPSALISFWICPPLAILKLIGAIRIRTEKRWLRTLFNTNTWADFIAMPNEKKEQLRDKMRDQLAQKTQYYYSELANGEIIKVPACSTIEARDMILAIEREEIEKRYEKYNEGFSSIDGNEVEPGIYNKDTDPPTFYSNLCQGDAKNVCKMWCVKFTDGQASYAFGLDGQRDQIMKEAEESKKEIVECYKKIVLKSKKGDDNSKNKTMKHLGIGTQHDKHGYGEGEQDDEQMIDELFAPPKVDDMIEIKNISMYSPITEANEKDFSEPTTSPMQWRSKQYPKYSLNFGVIDSSNYMIELKLPASKDDEVSIIMNSLINGFTNYITRQTETLKELANSKGENAYKATLFKYDINDSHFNIICIDDRRDESANANKKIEYQGERQKVILFSEIKDIVQSIEDAFRNTYSDANLERGVRNEFNSNYSKRATILGEDKFGTDRNNEIYIKCYKAWSNVINELRIGNVVQGQIVKQTGNEQIRQNIEIKLAA